MIENHEPIDTISGYLFTHLNQLEQWQNCLHHICNDLLLKGTILLAPEGINVNLAGKKKSIDIFLETIQSSKEFADIEFKRAAAAEIPYRRLWVKVKDEIIAVGKKFQDLTQGKEKRISPQELKQWYQENRDFHILDTRNQFELGFGTFENAIDLGLRTFGQFPQKVKETGLDKDIPIVVFCTGGIRCEKAAPIMVAQGFKHVYQLHGGILNYFQECGDDFYQGECFVFDQRISVDKTLAATGAKQCEKCEAPVPRGQWENSDLCSSCGRHYFNK